MKAVCTSINNKDAYTKLIDLAFDLCEEFILVVRNGWKINSSVENILSRLNSSLIIMKEDSKWLGSSIGSGNTARIYHYTTDDNSRKIIKEATGSFFLWLHPDLPEDLGFIKNGKPWLSNTAHENFFVIETDDEQERKKIFEIEGLNIRIFD